MGRIILFIFLFSTYLLYSFLVYTKGTEIQQVHSVSDNLLFEKGKTIFQEQNCISCHQVYGLGGYLGPDLTHTWTRNQRSSKYLQAILQNGGMRMPAFHFKKEEVEAVLKYLERIDIESQNLIDNEEHLSNR